jgi:sensor histidine kinase YesM
MISSLHLSGTKTYKYQAKINPIPDPRYFCLQQYSNVLIREWPWYDGSVYTIDDIIRNGKITVAPFFGMDSLFKIIEFQFSVIAAPDNNIKFLSPVFKGDSIPAIYAESLKKYFEKPNEYGLLHFKLQNVKVIGPDTLERALIDKEFAKVYADSTSLLIHKYQISKKIVRSNIRIKVSGNPGPDDLQTVHTIVNEINSLNGDLKAKNVNFFPTIEIFLDSADIFFGKDALNGYKQILNSNKFFPKLTYTRIFINTNVEDQLDRDLFLWQKITGSLAKINIKAIESGNPENNNSIIIGKSKIPALTKEDKLVLKAILSDDFDKRLESFVFSWTDKSNILLLVLVTIILFFVFQELNSYFGFGRRIKNVWLLNSVYIVLIAQLFLLTSLIMQTDFMIQTSYLADNLGRREFALLDRELYCCGFALIFVWLLTFSDMIFEKYRLRNWLKLMLSPVITLISLYLAYQFIYVFVRAEILRLITIDQNAYIIGFSIVLVRFYLQYENQKISGMLEVKEHELTRQKELKNRAELNTLQAKINPHFLYNALNSIAALAHIDSTRTEKMALSLSKLFRYNLNREENMMSTIGQEIEMVELYLQIEKQRFSDRLSFEFDVPENLYDRQVPRFLIQPLVENAIKHGISKITGQGLLKLKIYEQDKCLIIEIHDNGPEFPDGLSSGYGLQNTYDKLKLVYKKPYEIRFVNHPSKYIQIKL